MLDYDDSAFYYFSLAVLTFVLVPYMYFLGKTFYKGAVDLEWEGVNCETPWFQALIKAKKVKASKSIWTRSLFFRCLVFVFLSFIWYLNYDMVSSIEGLQSFDPYAILEVANDADEKAIRKQYRKMSLIKHPDKNPDNPLAVQEFIRLTKAYNVSDSHVLTFWGIDLDGRDSQTELPEVREPRRPRQLQRGYRNAPLLAPEREPNLCALLCFLCLTGGDPRHGIH